jgi:hypothetical protein
MSTVPYIFAGNTGNIPLSQLDQNFANVKLSVDYVIQNAQANITSVGTLTSLSVSGNIIHSGNLIISGNIQDSSQLNINTTAGNANIALAPDGTGIVTVSTQVSAVGNVTGGNILTGGIVSATGNVFGNNISATTAFRLPVYANTTVRNAAISSPVVGMLVVVGTTFQGYDGTSWGNINLT